MIQWQLHKQEAIRTITQTIKYTVIIITQLKKIANKQWNKKKLNLLTITQVTLWGL